MISVFAAFAWLLVSTACNSPSQPTSFGISCPSSQALLSPDGNPVTITYQAPTINGGASPVTTSCTPASGSKFPLGATLVTCTAEDAKHRTASCSFEMQLRVPPPKPPQLAATRFVAFGDSITEGFEQHACSTPLPFTSSRYFRQVEPVRPPTNDSPISYPNKLRALLSARYVSQTFTVINEGNGGEMVIDGAADFPRVLIQDQPQVVLIQEGANDVNQGRSPATIAASLRSMVRDAKGRGVLPYVGTLLPQVVGGCKAFGPAGIAPANDQIRAMAASEGVPLADLYQAFGVVPGFLIGPDGLHPSEAGYQKMAETFFDTIKVNLER